MFNPQRDDLANIINERVSDINVTADAYAKNRKVIALVAFFEAQQIPAAEARVFLQNLKDASKSGDSESVKTLHGITETIFTVAAQEGCSSIPQYKGKLTAAFESAKGAMRENGAAAKTGLVDHFYTANIKVLLDIAERVSALQGEAYTDPRALYEAIRDVKIDSAKPRPRNNPAPKL